MLVRAEAKASTERLLLPKSHSSPIRLAVMELRGRERFNLKAVLEKVGQHSRLT